MLEMFDASTREKIGWNRSVTPAPCNWIGVFCDERHHIGAISLAGKGLTGNLSARLSNLWQLKQLTLQENYLTGTIPELPLTMTVVNLANNSFNGSMPSLSGAANMDSLTLASNRLVGSVPDGFSQLQYLRTLDLSHNQLTSLGPLGRTDSGGSGSTVLPMLTDLDVCFNLISGTVPQGLEELDSLQRLDLQSNLLSGTLPLKLGNKPSLVSLLMAGNQLDGVVPNMTGKNLSRLTLAGNDWACPLPNISDEVWIDRLQTSCKFSSGGSGDSPFLMIAFITLAILYAACLLLLLRRLALRRARAREKAALLGEDYNSYDESATNTSVNVVWPSSDHPSPTSHPQAVSRRPSQADAPSPGGGFHRLRQGSLGGRQGSVPVPCDPTIAVFGPTSSSLFDEEDRWVQTEGGSPYVQPGRTMGLAAFPPYHQRAVGSPNGMFATPVPVGYESLRVPSGGK